MNKEKTIMEIDDLDFFCPEDLQEILSNSDVKSIALNLSNGNVIRFTGEAATKMKDELELVLVAQKNVF